MEADDILADQVDVGRPIALEQLSAIGIADTGQIIGQRVEPDVHDMVRAARNLHPPVEAGARDRQVAEAALDEAQHLVAAAVGLNECGLAA